MDAPTFDWNRARAFLATAEHGSFSAAARVLGVTQPTVGRQVAALEEELQVVLFERVGRSMELTPAGLSLLEPLQTMATAANDVALAASGQSASIEGTVSVSASELISVYLLPPIIERVRAEHPRIDIELVVTNAVSDLQRREADLAIRHFAPEQPELITKRIHTSTARPYASPAYLERIEASGPLTQLEDLKRASFFAYDRRLRLRDHLAAMGLELTDAHFPILTSNHMVQWSLCKRGLGVCLAMEELGEADPDVVQVLPGVFPDIPVPVFLTAHRALRTNRRLRVVWDLIAEGLS